MLPSGQSAWNQPQFDFASHRLSIEVGDMFFCSRVTMKKFQIFPCLSNRLRTCLFSCQKIVWHFGKSQNRKVVLKETKKLPGFFPQPSATTIDPFQFAALQLWFGRIEGIAEPWCGILKKDKPGKVAQLLKHPGWVHNVLFFKKIMCFYRYVPLHTELLLISEIAAVFEKAWKSCLKMNDGSTDHPVAVQLRKRHGTSNPSCDVRMARWSKIHECIFWKHSPYYYCHYYLTPGLSWATWPKISSSQPPSCQPLCLQRSCSRLMSFSFGSPRASVALRASKCLRGIKTLST